MSKTLPRQTSPLDQSEIYEFVSRLVKAGETNINIARMVERNFPAIYTTSDSIRRFRKRHGLNIPGTESAYTRVNGDDVEALCKPSHTILTDPDRMLKERGLDPTDWYVDDITVNEWEGLQKNNNKTKLYQTKFRAKRKRPHVEIMAARSDGWKAPDPPRISQVPIGSPHMVVIVGDTQCPFHDTHLHELFGRWLEANTPQEGVILGDTIDLPDISRHPFDPENTASVNECIQSGYDVLRGYVTASPDTQWKKLLGNHDIRLRDHLVQHARALYGLRRAEVADIPEESVLTVPYLLRLDELGITYVDSHGPYQEGQVELSPYLAVRHGWIAIKGSGASALRTLDHLGYSVIVGHTHRQSLVYHTVYDIDRSPTTLAAAEIGAMCRLDNRVIDNRRFPSYTVNPDWQNGWLTAMIWPDGRFRLEHATYAGGSVYWRDQRYS